MCRSFQYLVAIVLEIKNHQSRKGCGAMQDFSNYPHQKLNFLTQTERQLGPAKVANKYEHED